MVFKKGGIPTCSHTGVLNKLVPKSEHKWRPFKTNRKILISENPTSEEFPVNLFCPILLFLARARLRTINISQFN